MGAATYIVGPSSLFTPSDLKADADTLQAQVLSLSSQMETAQLPQNIQDAWALFVGQWRPFYDGNFGGFFRNLFTSLNDGNRDQLVQFETRFASIAASVNDAGVDTVGTDVAPNLDDGVVTQVEKQVFGTNPDGTAKVPDIFPSPTMIVVILVLLIVAIVAFKVL